MNEDKEWYEVLEDMDFEFRCGDDDGEFTYIETPDGKEYFLGWALYQEIEWDEIPDDVQEVIKSYGYVPVEQEASK